MAVDIVGRLLGSQAGDLEITNRLRGGGRLPLRNGEVALIAATSAGFLKSPPIVPAMSYTMLDWPPPNHTLAHDEIVDRSRGVLVAGDEEPAGGAGRQRPKPPRPFSGIVAGGSERLLRARSALAYETGCDPCARLGPTPDRDRFVRLEHGVIADEGGHANVGVGDPRGKEEGEEEQR